jgi:hypothetical protein
MPLRSVKKWSHYINRSLKRQTEGITRTSRNIHRRIANNELPPEAAQNAWRQATASVTRQRISRRDDRLYDRIIIDTAIKEFKLNKRLPPAALKKIRALSHQAMQLPLESQSPKVNQQFLDQLEEIARLIGNKELTKKYFVEITSLRRVYNESNE